MAPDPGCLCPATTPGFGRDLKFLAMTLALTILGGIAAASLAAYLTHYLTSRRDLRKRRAELRTEYLLGAYRAIASATRPDLAANGEDARALEQGLEDIQLLGNVEQIEIAVGVIEAMANGGEASPDDLLQALRGELRAELDLETVEAVPRHLRIKKPGGGGS